MFTGKIMDITANCIGRTDISDIVIPHIEQDSIKEHYRVYD
jgi:hypothetical protein